MAGATWVRFFAGPFAVSVVLAGCSSVWGAFIRFTLVSRAFGPGAELGFGPWKAPEIRRRTRRHPPSKLSGRRSGFGWPASPQSDSAESGPVVAPLGNSPPSHELPTRLERQQVSVKGASIQIMPLTWDSFLLPGMDENPWLTI